MKTVISTQMPEQFARLQKLIGKQVELRNVPMIKVEQLAKTEVLSKEINNAENYDWILFTSMRAIDFFFNIYEKNIENLKSVKFACIGISTQKKLAEYNIKAHYLNQGNTSIDFAKYLIHNNIISPQDKLMHPTGNKASNTLSKALKNYCKFKSIVIYNTIGVNNINDEDLEIIKNQNYSLILFTSPSAFINFVEITKGKIEHSKLKIATIGDITNAAVERYGLKSMLVADKPDLETVSQNIIKQLAIHN